MWAFLNKLLFVSPPAGNIKFIDYEYAGYNYQAFDIGNHFNEFAGNAIRTQIKLLCRREKKLPNQCSSCDWQVWMRWTTLCILGESSSCRGSGPIWRPTRSTNHRARRSPTLKWRCCMCKSTASPWWVETGFIRHGLESWRISIHLHPAKLNIRLEFFQCNYCL